MSRLTPMQLCQKYNYPLEVRYHLNEIRDIVAGANVRSLILTGSTSRGEFSYIRHADDSLTLLSDYEFYVIPGSRTTLTDRVNAVARLNKLEKNIRGKSLLFHIDISWIPRHKIPRLPHKFQVFETKTCGVTLYGEDLIDEIPEIDLDNLDYGELNEILIWRLWALLLYLPRCLIENNCNNRFYSYVLSRNALDLTTWALPHDKVLIPTFRRRVLYIKKNFSKLTTCQAIDSNLPIWLDEYSLGKFEVRFFKTTQALYSQIVKQFSKAVKQIKNRGSLFITNTRFPNWKPRRKAYEALGMWRGKGGLNKGLRWLLAPKYEMQLECLLEFHLAAWAYLNGDSDEAEQHLEIIRELLNRLLPWWQPQNTDSGGDFVRKWIALRNHFAELLMLYSRSVGEKRDYLNYVLEITS